MIPQKPSASLASSMAFLPESVRYVLGVQPDAHGVLFVFDGDQLGISLRRERMQGGDEIEFILSGGEERIHDLHGNFDFNLRLPGVVPLEHMHEQIAALLGYADIGVLVLNSDKFTVLGGADGVQKGAHVHAVAVRLIESDLATVETVLVDGGKNLFRELEGNVDAHRLLVGIRIRDADVQPAVMAGTGSRRLAAAA